MVTNYQFRVYDLKALGVFMFRLIKRVTGTPSDSVVNSKLCLWNDCTGLSDLN